MIKILRDLNAYFDRQSKLSIMLISIALVILLGVLDYLTGDLSLLVFIFVPLFLATWFVGKTAGFIIILISTILTPIVDLLAPGSSACSTTYEWDLFSKLLFFVIVVYCLSELKDTLRREAELARRDSLTGVFNGRAFVDLARREINRAQRYSRPFAFAYMDIDNFKEVNDTFGHNAGDTVLQIFSEAIKNNIRTVDIFARLGGDEFALLLPETKPEETKVVIERLRNLVMDALRKNGWSVTFSIGVATFLKAPEVVDEMIKRSDALMYSAKKSGKNMIKYEVCE